MCVSPRPPGLVGRGCSGRLHSDDGKLGAQGAGHDAGAGGAVAASNGHDEYIDLRLSLQDSPGAVPTPAIRSGSLPEWMYR